LKGSVYNSDSRNSPSCMECFTKFPYPERFESSSQQQNHFLNEEFNTVFCVLHVVLYVTSSVPKEVLA